MKKKKLIFRNPAIIQTLTVVGILWWVLFLFASLPDAFPTQIGELISIDSLQKHISVLGHDSLEGRSTGSRGGEKAARYIAQQMEKYQLIPLGINNSFFQKIPMHGSIPTNECQLRLFYKNNQVHDFMPGTDYLLYKTGAQTFVPIAVPLVFVGYGIIAPEYDYNDYRALDVRGKIVVFLEGEPISEDPSYFAGYDKTIYSLLESKQRLALAQGALGSIMIPTEPENFEIKWERLKREFAFEDITLAYNISGHLSVILHPREAAKLFRNSQLSLIQIKNLAARNKLRSFPLSTRLSFKGEYIERDFMASNIAGMISGTDQELKDTYIIISAHYDHLGIGPIISGDSIYNGVADNAMGVAGGLELARLFSQPSVNLRRSLIFLFTCGEEKGLLGSIYYIDHPLQPLHQTIANVNIDGLAMTDFFRDVIGVGSDLSSLGVYLEEAAAQMDLAVSPLPASFSTTESFSRSDQIAFAQAGIPALIIMDGFSLQNYTYQQAQRKFIDWIENIYHTPFDDLHQSLHFGASKQHVQLLSYFIWLLANCKQKPVWNVGVPYRAISPPAKFESQ